MDIINLPGWNVIGANEDGRVYTIHAEYGQDDKGCPFCSFVTFCTHKLIYNTFNHIERNGINLFIINDAFSVC